MHEAEKIQSMLDGLWQRLNEYRDESHDETRTLDTRDVCRRLEDLTHAVLLQCVLQSSTTASLQNAMRRVHDSELQAVQASLRQRG